jgi:2-polyprenyl-6-methoxyphenol hydroxylase-like FAD-dependent oxidoreductase
MNTGIQDAAVLGDILAAVVAGRASESHLYQYERVRRPVAVRVVELTDRLTRVATVRSDAGRIGRNMAIRVIGRVPAIRGSLRLSLPA